MTSVGNAGYSNLASQAPILSGSRSVGKRISSGPFKHIEIDLTEELIAQRNKARERAKLKSETGERWTSNSLYKVDFNSVKGYTVNKDALNKVEERLTEEGIDPSRRTPTHEITDEQMAQLAQKYDLVYLSFAGMDDPEYGNFLLDLAYMNVFSFSEMEELFGVSEVAKNFHAGSYIIPLDGSSEPYYLINGERFKSWDDITKAMNREYLQVKYPGRTENYYQQMTEDFMVRAEERMNVIEDFFDRASKYFYPGLADTPKPKIEDASEKLKEDFGNIL